MNLPVADELEARLEAVNEQPALRRANDAGGAWRVLKEDQTEKQRGRSEYEKVRRGGWRRHVERISRLFRASGESRWTRRDVLSLGETLFRING